MGLVVENFSVILEYLVAWALARRHYGSSLVRFLTDRCASAAGWLGLVSCFEQE